MRTAVSEWFRKNFADPDIVMLTLAIIAEIMVIVLFGHLIMPVLASIVIAYLLEGVVSALVRKGMPRFPAVLLVFTGFLVFVAAVVLWVLPLFSRQLTQLVQQLPNILAKAQAALLALPEQYPELISTQQVQDITNIISQEIAGLGQHILSFSISSVVGLITLSVYLVLMPLLVFFFLKDKDLIVGWVSRFLPSDNPLSHRVWRDVDRQIANYVRGKFVEIIIVFAACFVAFSVLNLEYGLLLAVLVGLSVIIPYVGAAVVTIPVLAIAWFQWGGWSNEFLWVSGVYFVIQALDGNVLVPLLFSEVVNLHPVAIIVAILIFGGVWGFWGVFFAIPLATLVQSILSAWPRRTVVQAPPD